LKQLSVFIENKPGRMADVTGFLADAGVNIHALCIADTTDFGILRLIVNDVNLAKSILRERGFTVKTTDVLAVSLTHKPGSLAGVLKELDKANVSIEYMYAFTGRDAAYDAMVVLCLLDQDKAMERIALCDIQLVDADMIGRLNHVGN
jgi:hypothetical protein